MADVTPRKLDPSLDPSHDHVLGTPQAEMTLVEYGSYACAQCHSVHEIVESLRREFGNRLRYVFRHSPLPDDDRALRAAEFAEFGSSTTGKFWEIHDALMERGSSFSDEDLDVIAAEFGLPPLDSSEPAHVAARRAAEQKVRDDSVSAQRSGARVTPTFFIGGRRYEGLWDESSLTDALLGSLGHRIQSARLHFLDWGPSAGFLLGLTSLIAITLANTGLGAAVESFWRTSLGVSFGSRGFLLSLVDWVNHGLLTIFFLVVGLEIKREMTVGHLATSRKAALPVLAAAGGIALPALIYLALAPPGPLRQGWAIPIATDTAFAVAVIVLLGTRVPVELRVFLTAAVIIDDLVAIVVIAMFYTGELGVGPLAAAVVVTAALVALNRCNVYSPLPYALLGIVLWVLLHEAGLHATLAGVILAVVTPTRPPANLRALTMQADAIIAEERRRVGAAVMRPGPSDRALRALDTIHGRIESPADKLLRTVEPWSSYVVLPIFALANAGVAWSLGVFEENGRMMLAVVAGLVVGKPVGILLAARLAVRSGIAVKSGAYTWRQLGGAAALAGIGFTMSLFIAGQAFPEPHDYAAAKIAIFLASLLAGGLGAGLLVTGSEGAEALASTEGHG